MSMFSYKEDAIHYQAEGDGPGLVFLHGLGGSSINWLNQRNYFKSRFKVISVDLPGHGKSTAEGPVTFTDYQQIVKHLVSDILQLDAVFLCGVSMGGRVALDFAAHHPELTAGLVAADTFAGLDEDEQQHRKEVFNLLDEPNGEEKWVQRVIDEMGLDPDGPVAKGFNRGILGNQLDFIRGLFLQLVELDQREQLSTIKAPVLLLHGERDRFVPRSSAEDLHRRLPQSTLKIIPDCGHLPNVEQPKVFNQLVEEFVD
jgi:sigma-B regulation protein RsbQ